MNSLIFVGDATPMETILKDLVGSSPLAVALLIVFWIGLKHIEKKDTDNQKMQELHRETFERLHAQCDEQQERSGVIASDCAKVIGRADATLCRLENTLQRIEAKG